MNLESLDEMFGPWHIVVKKLSHRLMDCLAWPCVSNHSGDCKLVLFDITWDEWCAMVGCK